MLKCLKDWSDCDPLAAQEFVDSIPEQLAYEAGVEVAEFNQAVSVLKFEGEYGSGGLGPGEMSVSRAREIVSAARKYRFSDIKFCDSDDVEREIDGSIIHNEVWAWYRRIYG